MRIQNKKTDLAAKIKFKETGLLGGSKNAHQVRHWSTAPLVRGLAQVQLCQGRLQDSAGACFSH